MLSIIISSYQHKYFNQIIKNIHETIGDGFEYEIIQIWNPNVMSITEAYTQGAEKSKFNNYLFLHEDLIFKTKNWGEKLQAHLDYSHTGIIGIAGSSYVPTAPSSWTVAEKYNFVNILQGNKQNDEFIKICSVKEYRTKVFAVDGVFLAIRKEYYNEIKFDENLKGFHAYDLDFSLRVSKKFQNYVVNDILIQHFSSGNLDDAWLNANIRIREKVGSKFQENFDSETERDTFIGFLYKYFSYYPVTLQNIFFTLKFYPSKRLYFGDQKIILKKYFHYLKYSSSINKRINSSYKD